MDIIERLRKRAGSLMPPTMDELYEAADEIEKLRLAVGGLVHAYDNEWKVNDAVKQARQVMADGYNPWVEVERLREEEEFNLRYIKSLVLEKERLREALQMLLKACESGWHPMKITGAELFTARAALKETE